MNREKLDWTAWRWLVPVALLMFVLFHSIGLTKLPIFADEAIYLRWAQLIISEPGRYAFFPVNDGKTPLFVWSVIPMLLTKMDPLLAGRLWSVAAGVLQIVVLGSIAKKLKWGKLGVVTTFAFITLAPFWFFNHRMALMDAWLTTMLSVTMLSLLMLYEKGKDWQPSRKTMQKLFADFECVGWFLLSALAFGAALFIKIPAILAALPLVLTPWLVFDAKRAVWWSAITALALGGGLGLAGLVLLHPTGPQLFSRSGDFLLPVSQIIAGGWRETLPSGDTYLGYFWQYLTPGIMILSLVPLFFQRTRRVGTVLLLQFLLFFTPIWILGRVVYPRYLFPASLWLTLSAVLGLVTLVHWGKSERRSLVQRVSAGVLLISCVLVLGVQSLQFVLPSWVNPNTVPFNTPDSLQYHQTWSSGHGVDETYILIKEWAQTHPGEELVVATEGRFGTLPDALLLKNFNTPLPNVRIEASEVVEIYAYPKTISQFVGQNTTVWLVVNSSRLYWELPEGQLIAQFCRPKVDDCLQVWDITEQALLAVNAASQ